MSGPLLLLALAAPAPRPNVVFVVAEDLSPTLGCYAHPDGRTPHLDKLATQGARFTRAFTHAPVCAPSRSGLITGMYPTSMGSHHMRSKLVTPPPLWADELRKAGYFFAWPGKTDFNFDPPKGWADTTVDWTKKPDVLPKDRPFFAYANFSVCHESQARAKPEVHAKNTARLTPGQRHDPATVRLPPYYPDTPAVRQNVAQHHDTVSAMDHQVGDVLKLLDDRGWAENTVVVFFGDHGWGLPRGKRWPYDSGARVPLLVRWPGKVAAGGVRDDLVCFLDLGPTVLSLAGVTPPARLQGRVMLGDKTAPPPDYVVTCRDRMDEAEDRVRSLRGERFRYVRNFRPELPYFQYVNYLDEMPITKEWRRLAFAGGLTPVQKQWFARTKPAEELYDTAADPHEVANLAADPKHAATLAAMRAALDKWAADTNDLGAVPEPELIRRGVVKDVLSVEYVNRRKLHPATPPVP